MWEAEWEVCRTPPMHVGRDRSRMGMARHDHCSRMRGCSSSGLRTSCLYVARMPARLAACGSLARAEAHINRGCCCRVQLDGISLKPDAAGGNSEAAAAHSRRSAGQAEAKSSNLVRDTGRRQVGKFQFEHKWRQGPRTPTRAAPAGDGGGTALNGLPQSKPDARKGC